MFHMQFWSFDSKVLNKIKLQNVNKIHGTKQIIVIKYNQRFK